MWKAWKDTFNPLHKNIERETRLARGEDFSGVASAAQTIHGIDPSTVPAPFRGKTPNLPKGANLAKDFDVCFNNLYIAAMHINEIVQGTLGQLYQSSTS